jgi:hypothetical protein
MNSLSRSGCGALRWREIYLEKAYRRPGFWLPMICLEPGGHPVPIRASSYSLECVEVESSEVHMQDAALPHSLATLWLA